MQFLCYYEKVKAGTTLLDSRYELGQLLGQGAMGRVFKAFDLKLERHVAIKMVQTGEDDTSLLTKRLTKEAQTCANLDHPNIVKVFDTFSRDGSFCIVMELIEGTSLAIQLEKNQPIETLMEFVLQMTRALEYAHNHNIVHRDLKPENILVTKDGIAKVTDWGLARSIEEEKGLTKTGVIVGTPEYMAPERIMTAKTSPASDMYSLGCILFEIIEGQPPFVNKELSVVVQSHLHKSPSKIFKGPLGCSLLVNRLLSKEPKQRMSASEVIAFLQSDKKAEGLLPKTAIRPVHKKSSSKKALIGLWISLLFILTMALHPLVFPEKVTKSAPSRLQRLRQGDELVLQEIGIKLVRRNTKGLSKEAVVSALKRAAKNSGEANFYLGICYQGGILTRPDYEKAKMYFIKAGELGYARAYSHLGLMYEDGVSFPIDFAKAIEYYQKAEKLGDQYGLVRLGNRYFWGGGFTQDGNKAFAMFQEAYDKGCKYAAYYLAYCYEEGVGTKLNWQKSRHYYEVAAKAGYGQAAKHLGTLHERGLAGTAKSAEQAFYWYERAYELGSLDGWSSLANCYLYGIGTSRDTQKAIRWFKELRDINFPKAYYKLGQCYEKGIEVPKDPQIAFDLYLQGSKLGSKACIEALSICYSKGIGCKRNSAKAEEYRKQLGESLLEEMLGRIDSKLK